MHDSLYFTFWQLDALSDAIINSELTLQRKNGLNTMLIFSLGVTVLVMETKMFKAKSLFMLITKTYQQFLLVDKIIPSLIF